MPLPSAITLPGEPPTARERNSAASASLISRRASARPRRRRSSRREQPRPRARRSSRVGPRSLGGIGLELGRIDIDTGRSPPGRRSRAARIAPSARRTRRSCRSAALPACLRPSARRRRAVERGQADRRAATPAPRRPPAAAACAAREAMARGHAASKSARDARVRVGFRRKQPTWTGASSASALRRWCERILSPRSGGNGMRCARNRILAHHASPRAISGPRRLASAQRQALPQRDLRGMARAGGIGIARRGAGGGPARIGQRLAARSPSCA